MKSFDELISNGELTKAARLFAKEYYDSGKMGHTRKLLIEVLADKYDKYDEAIARQSVKSEEVAEAIEWLKGMERSYNLDRATGFASSKHDEAAEHCRVLLTALQAYQPEPPKGE